MRSVIKAMSKLDEVKKFGAIRVTDSTGRAYHFMPGGATNKVKYEGEGTPIPYYEVMREVVIKSFGLSGCADTIVGDGAHRGISGGEKKRVTCAEMIAGRRRCVLLDEIS